ncbi:hypothetical protein Pyn_15471 [Prunus yedoensis var. nudiflora]|uniref:Uncharacterized protein n=1 Tax=Prunus yedoensis var. nudiflora TaxID=2094558 RepID=A0A314Z2Q8_PRUYE|nr:hypothetical protein Pyn_15471 [Prunus yedoensis var. nudiflora]
MTSATWARTQSRIALGLARASGCVLEGQNGPWGACWQGLGAALETTNEQSGKENSIGAWLNEFEIRSKVTATIGAEEGEAQHNSTQNTNLAAQILIAALIPYSLPRYAALRVTLNRRMTV